MSDVAAVARGSRERARAAATVLARRRARRWRPTPYQVYVTVLALALAGAVGGHALSRAVGPGLTAHALAVWGPSVVALVLLATLRFGTWQGPVLFSLGDVAVLLCAPIAVADLVRPRLRQAAIVAAALGALVGAVATLLCDGGPASLGVARTICAIAGAACLGAVACAGAWLVQASGDVTRAVLRASGPIVLLAGGLVVAADHSHVVRDVAIWSGPWGWTIAPLAGTGGWPAASGVLVLSALGLGALASLRAGAGSVERFLERAQARAGITTSVGVLDYRSAALARRAAGGGAAPRLRRLPRPRRAALAVPWRDCLALLRAPARVAWATLLAAAATWDAVRHPGGTLPALFAAGALYASAGLLCEPLRVEVDQPDRGRVLLGLPFARLLVAHLVVPVVVLGCVCAATVVAAVVAGVASPALLVLAITLVPAATGVAVLSAGLAARRGGRVDGRLLATLLATAAADPTGGLSAVLFLAPWLLLCLAVVGGSVLLLGHAVAHHHPVLASAVPAVAVAAAVLAVLVGRARRSAAPDG